MVHNEYNGDLARTIASRLGLVVGVFWIVSFLTVVNGINSLLTDVGVIIGLLSILYVGKTIRLVASNIMPMRWVHRYWLALLAFLGGVLFTTLAQFIYFAYFDHGHFFGTLAEMFQDPVVVQQVKATGNEATLKQAVDALGMIREMSPRIIALNCFTHNVMLALFFALLASLFRGKPAVKSGS